MAKKQKKEFGSGSFHSQTYTLKPKFIGATFWNPITGENILLVDENIEWFVKNFATVEGYTHFFEIKEE